ncbi:hypothetical protein F5Y08DRAFT_354298 [Xylaria arbuscula]|nr:hypothetical protein F5Y08DRAFT_354298 [Xylaria arbuscula]
MSTPHSTPGHSTPSGMSNNTQPNEGELSPEESQPPTSISHAPSQETICVPDPGGIYIIRHIQSGKVITVIDGSLILEKVPRKRGGIYWCYQQFLDGWAALRNTVSGMHLGYDHMTTTAPSALRDLGPSRCFLQPRHPRGYGLYIKYYRETLAPLVVVREGPDHVIVLDDGEDNRVAAAAVAIWEFIGVR